MVEIESLSQFLPIMINPGLRGNPITLNLKLHNRIIIYIMFDLKD
jgi:2-succinyl-5-enolpyruvyl-6-hydroxy-3-cyclohexene-1-carboxylate synthase